MSRPAVFLKADHVAAIHRRMIREFGGEAGLRDRGLLESAASMPAAGAGGKYLHRGLAEKAAAYLYHLCRNHPFVDGNKRTALAAAEVFLLLNDRALAATNEELERLTRGVAEGTISKREALRFFRRHVTAVS